MAIGQKLEEARNRKGISLREASESTKIRGDYLSAMEASSFDIDLTEVYLRGFVKLYARFLDLDQESILADLDLELGKVSGKTAKKSLGSIANTEVSENSDFAKSTSTGSAKPSNYESNLSKPIFFATGLVAIVLLIVGILYVTFSGESEVLPKGANENSTIQEVAVNPSSVPLMNEGENPSDIFTLKLAAIGPIELLIIDDQGEGTLRDFKNLDTGWEYQIKIAKSFRCHCSNLENLRFAIDDGKEKQIDSSGAGNFSWSP